VSAVPDGAVRPVAASASRRSAPTHRARQRRASPLTACHGRHRGTKKPCVRSVGVNTARSVRRPRTALIVSVSSAAGPHNSTASRRSRGGVSKPTFISTRTWALPAAGEARVVLDDGSEEVLGHDSLGTDPNTGRVECLVRGGHARAAFSRSAHQALLPHVEETRGRFYLRVGSRRLAIRAGA
jgi:hypothetical protein